MTKKIVVGCLAFLLFLAWKSDYNRRKSECDELMKKMTSHAVRLETLMERCRSLVKELEGEK